MNPKRSVYIKLATRIVSVAMAAFAFLWACLMILVFYREFETHSVLEVLAIVSLFITLPVLFTASAILLIREWSRRTIESFAALFSLAIIAPLVEPLRFLLDAKMAIGDQAGNLIWASGCIVLLVAVYVALREMLIVSTEPKGN